MKFAYVLRRWIPAFAGGVVWHFLTAFALSIAIAATLSGCHHSSTSSSGTPVGQTMMQIQGVALDSHGNPLNATRGLPMIEVDVLAAQ